MKHKYNIEKIDRKIEERKNINFLDFIDRMQDLLELKNVKTIKRVTFGNMQDVW